MLYANGIDRNGKFLNLFIFVAIAASLSTLNPTCFASSKKGRTKKCFQEEKPILKLRRSIKCSQN